jgi:acyl-CoA synthetase (AMP-forming)/AMP-acid ligase II
MGSSFVALARSGLLGPYSPAQVLRAATALRRGGVGLGTLYALGAALHASNTAALDDAGGSTFADMAAGATSVANGLAGLGIGPESKVALLCRNHRGFLLAMVALAQLGADTVYLNTGFAGPQLAAVVEGEAVDALIIDEEFIGLTKGLEPGVVVVVAGSDDPTATSGSLTLETMAGVGGPARPRPSRVGRQVLLTSGTTGAPKGAGRGTPTNPGPILGVLARIPYRSGDTTVMAAPMFHAWGLANTTFALACGATLVLPRRFEPEDTLRRIAETRASVLVAVPVMLQRIMDLPAETRARYDVSSLRVVALSGSALPGELAVRWMDAFGDNLYNLYGSTEVGWVSVAGPVELRRAPGTAGRVLPGVTVRFVDDEGVAVDGGMPGRIMVRSDLTFDGYTNGTSKLVVDGAMSSGDVGHLEDGLLFIDGRDDEMIVSGGENVFPREVEDLIADHPGVAEVSVLGVPDEDFGQRLEAWVVRRAGSSVAADELTGLVRAHLARFKVPRRVHFVAELPRTTTGKVLRRALVTTSEED